MSEVFGQYGECECRLMRTANSGFGCFVEYGTVEEMKAAIGEFKIT